MKKQIREVLSKYRGNQGYTMEHAERELLYLFSDKLSLPTEDEINSMKLEIDCPTPHEEEYTTSGFKSGVRWLINRIKS